MTRTSRSMPLCSTGDTISNRCLSCGTSENMGKRRYCSVDCRQRLRHQLNIRTGLLKALNTKYATFYFTDILIIMDVLPFDVSQIFSFIFPRSQNGKPVQDFSKMADQLGNAWWAEVRRTQRRYLASRMLLEQASKNHSKIDAIKPLEIKKPALIGNSIIHLQLNKAQLEHPDLEKVIKQAYRKQALRCHPDHGGDAASFRRIHDAYKQLLNWSESPTFVRRRGFPDKWFYDGWRNRWIQPTPSQ